MLTTHKCSDNYEDLEMKKEIQKFFFHLEIIAFQFVA